MTPSTVAHQAPLSMGTLQARIQSGLPYPPPGIFSTQGLNSSLLHCRQVLYCLSHWGSSRILEWVAYPFSRGSFWPRNRIQVSYIAGGFFTDRATSWLTNNIVIVSDESLDISKTYPRIQELEIPRGERERGKKKDLFLFVFIYYFI